LERYGDFYHFPFWGDQLLYKGIYDVIITLVGSTLLNFFFESCADWANLSKKNWKKKYDYFSDKSGCIFWTTGRVNFSTSDSDSWANFKLKSMYVPKIQKKYPLVYRLHNFLPTCVFRRSGHGLPPPPNGWAAQVNQPDLVTFYLWHRLASSTSL
jgi:hypothetical protein